MGKRTRTDSARNANLAKALVKKKKINNENKENINIPVQISTPNVSDASNTLLHALNVSDMPATSIGAFCDVREVLANQSEQQSLHLDMPVVEQYFLSAEEEVMSDSELLHTETENSEDEGFDASDDAGEEIQGSVQDNELREGHRRVSPTIPACQSALLDLIKILNPLHKNGTGHLAFSGDDILRKHLKMMQMFLWMYVDQRNPRTWTKASRDTAQAHQKAAHTAQLLRKWARSFVKHHGNLPMNLYGSWNVSLLDKGDLAEDIVDYLAQPNVQQKHGLKKTISLATAQRWMHMMDFCWMRSLSGQYVDGHKRDDVVTYRQKKFLPSIAELFIHMRTWKDGLEEASDEPHPHTQCVVLWFHDESTFYANDRRKVYWVHGNETAKPHPKGEGASLMVADFVSADYGWLRSSCGEEAARILFHVGKSQDGYFTNASILRHAELAMDILD
ncbi:hypothetical protein BDR03DRAFT_1011698 [Suillus americanus]|nr:hypothetical protein BDR03DRAFT_1011698 [Suillus americanus]